MHKSCALLAHEARLCAGSFFRQQPVAGTVGDSLPMDMLVAAPVVLTLVLQISTADMAAWEQLKRDGGSSSSSSSSGSSTPTDPGTPTPAAVEDPDAGVQRDWKGDPIKFNPGVPAAQQLLWRMSCKWGCWPSLQMYVGLFAWYACGVICWQVCVPEQCLEPVLPG